MAEMEDDGEWDDREFEKCFREFDKDGSGTIDKQEMMAFIKKLAGYWTNTQNNILFCFYF